MNDVPHDVYLGPTLPNGTEAWVSKTLAKALLAKPNVLLLDEPTNHLDWQAILWLDKYLVSEELNEVALVVVSHDRDFLDKVSTMTLRLFEMKLQVHSGQAT